MVELKKILTEREFSKYPFSSFDVIGDIVILNMPKELKKKERRIAKAFLEGIPNAKTVAAKKEHVSSVERIQKVRILCGEKRTATIHKENGFRFFLDIDKVYFSPRLNNERLRIANSVKKNEIVYDMFCGVGPYAIQLAKKCKLVVANDINKNAVAYLKRNIGLNRIDNIVPYNTDAKSLYKIVKKHGKADRIVMNHPTKSMEFIGTALKIAKKGAIIHFYTFVRKDEKFRIESDKLRIKKIVNCGEYSPAFSRICVDLVKL